MVKLLDPVGGLIKGIGRCRKTVTHIIFMIE
jgi:hypothetical protein